MVSSFGQQSVLTRELSFDSEPMQIQNLTLVSGNKLTREEFLVEISVESAITLSAKGAADGQFAWRTSFPRESGVFTLTIDCDTSVVGLYRNDFLSILVLTLRGSLFIELSCSELDSSWSGTALSREFSR